MVPSAQRLGVLTNSTASGNELQDGFRADVNTDKRNPFLLVNGNLNRVVLIRDDYGCCLEPPRLLGAAETGAERTTQTLGSARGFITSVHGNRGNRRAKDTNVEANWSAEL